MSEYAYRSEMNTSSTRVLLRLKVWPILGSSGQEFISYGIRPAVYLHQSNVIKIDGNFPHSALPDKKVSFLLLHVNV